VLERERARHALGRLDAVLKRQNERMGAHERGGGTCGFDHLPGLHAQDDAIDDADARCLTRDARGGDEHVALGAADLQARLLDGGPVRATCDEGDLVPGLREASTKVSPNSSDPDDGEAQTRLLAEWP
jgi:hypothetical protein